MKNLKTERIQLRVTPAEKEIIENRAWKARMSVSEYIVALANDKPIIIIDDVARLVGEIIKVGTNVNQIARIANSQKNLKREHLEAVENEMSGIQLTLSALLKKIDRSAEEKGSEDGNP